MANIIRSNGNEPFRLIRELMGYDPFRELESFSGLEDVTTFNPSFEVKETKEGFSFKADVPGMKEKDLDVLIVGNQLTISGKREAEKQEKTDTFYAYERSYGSFSRSFTLPSGVDAEKIKAELKDGVLMLTLPKKPEVQPKKIEVKAEGKEAEEAKA